jgi:hypothetical protein
MKLELIGKRQIRFLAFKTQKKKMGQKDKLNAISGQAVVRLPNTMLDMFDPALRTFLFQRNSAPNPQAEIPNMTMELQELTPAAKALGALHWAGEQGGSKIKVYQGITTDMDFTITGATLSKYMLTPIEGGYFDWRFSFYSSDNIDRDLIGSVGEQVTESPEVEIIAPEVMNAPQGELLEEEEDPLTPEKAFAQSLEEKGTAAEGRTERQLKAAKKARQEDAIGTQGRALLARHEASEGLIPSIP